MQLWMSRAISTHLYTFWHVQPEVTWDRDEPVIGIETRNTASMLCNGPHIHELFPALEIPPGEMIEIEIVALENGYYIGFVECTVNMEEAAKMQLWMSRAVSTRQYTFWYMQPEVTWDRDEPIIGYEMRNTASMLCDTPNIHVLFPDLEIPPGEMIEIEIVELKNGYYVGFVE